MRGVWQVSIRRACGVLQFRNSTYHYKSRRQSYKGADLSDNANWSVHQVSSLLRTLHPAGVAVHFQFLHE